MDDAKSGFQVVEVLGECRLQDANRQEHTYWRRDGKSLAQGFYVVSWPPGAVVGRFHEDAVFRGPFQQRDAADTAMQRLKEERAKRGQTLENDDDAVLSRRLPGDRLKAYRRPT